MAIVEVIFPVFAIGLVGYMVAYLGLFSAQDISAISRFVFVIALPVMLFNSLANIDLPDRINWQFLLSYYMVALLIFVCGMLVSGREFSFDPVEQSVFGLGSSYSNTVLVGLPIILSGLGEKALLPIVMLISVNSAILFTMVTLMAERNGDSDRPPHRIAIQTVKSLAKNPIIIGLMLGLLFNLLKIPVPRPITATMELISQAALPSALFVLGASLSAYKISGHIGEAWTMVGLKLLLMPMLVAFMAIIVFKLDPLWSAVAIMTAGMPVGINAYMFSQKYQAGIATVSTAILISTILAAISQSMLLVIFR